MSRIALPPTPLASSLISTLIICATARLVESNVEVEVRRENNTTVIKVDVAEDELLSNAVHVLDRLASSDWIRQIRGKLPFTSGSGPGTDSDTVGKIFSRAGLAKPSLKAENRVLLYGNFVKIIHKSLRDLKSALKHVDVKVEKDNVIRISLGAAEYNVPVIVKSEVFYEMGRFGGISDRRAGRPNIGRIEYKAALPIASLLYALLLALQSGYEASSTDIYMFTTLSLEPGNITTSQAYVVCSLYESLCREIFKISLKVWLQDYEGLRIVSILKLLEELMKLKHRLIYIPTNVALIHSVFASTGKRFFPTWNVQVSFSELDVTSNIVRSLLSELGVSNFEKLLKLLRVLVIASLDMASRLTCSSVREFWLAVRMLSYYFIEGRKYEIPDILYRMLRLLADTKTGFKAEVIASISRVSRNINIELADLTLESSESIREALWRSLVKLVRTVVA